MIHQYHCSALQSGPKLVVLGAIHGNETAGTLGIRHLQQAFENRQLTLSKGSLTLIPICNPKAYTNHVRYIERNLNRELYPKKQLVHYEDFLNPIICAALESADVLLDLHSYASKGGPFVFLGDTTQAEIDYCLHLGIEDIVYGWTQAFHKQHSDPKISMGTTEYARSHGALAVTVECGHHYNEDGPAIAYRTTLAALAYLNMIDLPTSPPRAPTFVQMQQVFYKQKPGVFTKPWQHFDWVEQDEPLARFDDGSELLAPAAGCIILPKAHVELGQEWFFFGMSTQCPQPLIE